MIEVALNKSTTATANHARGRKSGLRRRYEGIVAYLATRPHGSTVDETATALQPTDVIGS